MKEIARTRRALIDRIYSTRNGSSSLLKILERLRFHLRGNPEVMIFLRNLVAP